MGCIWAVTPGEGNSTPEHLHSADQPRSRWPLWLEGLILPGGLASSAFSAGYRSGLQAPPEPPGPGPFRSQGGSLRW